MSPRYYPSPLGSHCCPVKWRCLLHNVTDMMCLVVVNMPSHQNQHSKSVKALSEWDVNRMWMGRPNNHSDFVMKNNTRMHCAMLCRLNHTSVMYCVFKWSGKQIVQSHFHNWKWNDFIICTAAQYTNKPIYVWPTWPEGESLEEAVPFGNVNEGPGWDRHHAPPPPPTLSLCLLLSLQPLLPIPSPL